VQASLILADSHERAHNKQRAAERFDVARKVAEEAAAQDPTDMRAAAFLCFIYEGLGRCTTGVTAADWFSRSVTIWKSWPTRAKSSVYDQEHLKQAERLLEAARR